MTTLLESSAQFSDNPAVLAIALEQGCNLAVWERAPIQGAEMLIEHVTQDIRFNASLAELPDLLNRELSDKNYADCLIRKAFAADVEQLATLYSDALSLDCVNVRVEIVTTDSCRKWHADYVTARLITTYVGSGTDWLDARDAARVRNGLGPKQIHSLKAGDVGMFQGKLGTDSPAMHRSPPIAGTGERRLLLVLNPPEDV